MRLTRQFAVAAALSLAGIGIGCGGGGGGTDAPPVGPATTVSVVSGAGASVSAGTTAPISLVAKVTDAAGHSVVGASVSWTTASGSITPGSASTDGAGTSTAQWTPGHTAGAQTATATVSGATAASFSATVNAGSLAKVKLTPDTTRLNAVGQTAQLTATGLDAFDNTISGFAPTFAIVDPNVASVDAATGLLTAKAAGTTTVSAGSGVASASATVIVAINTSNPCVGATMTLATVGASQTLTGSAASQFCVNGGATGAEFVAVPFYATGNGGKGSGQSNFTPAPTLNVVFNPLTNVSANGPPTPNVLSNLQLRASVIAGGAPQLTRDVAWEAKFRERSRRELSPMLAVARKGGRSSSSSLARNSLNISAAVNVGEPMSLNVNVDSACAAPIIVSATVQAVTTHAIVVSDNRNPAGFTSADYQSIANSFDSQVWPTDTDNFGVPYATPVGNATPVRDPSGKIILFFTIAVNQLTPANQSSFVGGFFFGRDLFPKAQCGGSNETEMFYLLAPDPAGAFNNIRSAALVKSITVGTVAHEFQHLINAAYRFYVPGISFREFEETFLDEGLAHVAEELNFYTATGMSPRTNIDAAGVTADPTAYRAFAQQNAVRFRDYLNNPDRYPPYSVLADTSLAVRGGIWSFLRYATDRHVGNGGSEKATWNQLVNPTSDVAGLNNLQKVFGSDILTQMRDWSVANYLDDALGVAVPTAFQHPSWQTRSVETYVNGTNGNPGTAFPLKTFSLLSAQVPIDLADGGAAYLRFGVAAGAVGGATVTSSGTLPTTFSITVVRTK